MDRIVHRSLLMSLTIFLVLPQRSPGQDSPKKSPKWSCSLMMKVKQIQNVQVAPNGRRVVYGVREPVMKGEKSEYVTQLHLSNADGSDPIQLTFAEKSSENPQWSPDGEWIAFTSSRSGKGNIWLIRARGGEAERLTDVKTGVNNFKWSPDGRLIAFTAAEPPTAEEEKATKEKNDVRVVDEDVKMNHLYVIAVEKNDQGEREARKLTKGKYNVGDSLRFGGFDWSPDGRTIAFSHTRTPKADDWPTADIFLVDVQSGSEKPLVHTRAAEHSPMYSPDGTSIAYCASDDPPTWGFNFSVRVIPAEGGKPRDLAPTADRSPRLVGWSADGEHLYYTEIRGTTMQVNVLPLDGEPKPFSQVEGVIGNVSLNHTREMIGFTMEKVDSPPEAHLSRLERFDAVAVSRANRELPKAPLGRTEVIQWKSADDFDIEGLLTYPVDYEEGQRYPLLLVIHGGPAGVFSQNFIGSAYLYPVATFAARGYAVLRPNVRGSSGYGKKFRYANYEDWGGKDYQDLLTGVDHVIKLGVADADRLGVMGWSYGGFMTSWVITQTKRFKAASVGAGVTNLMSFTGTADIPSFLPDYFRGEYWDKFDVYRAHSAMFHVKGVSTPTLIQHGEKDDRVPVSQGYEFYNALKRQGCPVKMVVYPRTPHGPQEPKFLLDIMRRNVEWFDEYLASKDESEND